LPAVFSPSQLNRIFRFGTFEFSVRALELRKNGEVLRLQQQPLRVLLVLLECSGEAITREEIRARVWPDANVQDFDNSLRVAINKLRQALGDDPEHPQYVETLPRRGYRWLYPVTVQDSPPNALEKEGQRAAGHDPAQMSAAKADHRWSGLRQRGVGFRSVLFTVSLVVAALAAGRYLRPAPDVNGPKVSPLTTYPGLEYMPSISPDGKRVAFAWTGSNAVDPYGVYIKLIGEERAHRLTETPAGASDGDPVWSPDGKSIYFFRRGEASGIYIAPAEGGAAREVLATSLGDRRLRRARFDVSPDGRTVAYPDEIPGQQTIALFLLDLNTMQTRQITNPPLASEGDGDPAFSHDGKSLAFRRDTLDLQQVYVMTSGGGEARLLTFNLIAHAIDGLAWTPNDREIIFGGKQLRRVSVTERGPAIANVSYVPGPSVFPAIHGNWLAYVQAATNANIWKLELRDPVHVAREPSKLIASTRQQAAASYSPDGSRIVFQSDRSGDWEIWICERDGSNAEQLTHFGGVLAGSPRWSPDGRQIAFDSRANGTSQIYVVSVNGGEPRRLTDAATGAAVASWSRDGRWIYYSTVRGGASNLWKVPSEGGAAQPVTRDIGVYAVESPDGRYLYFSRSPLDPTIWRVPVGGGAEELVPGAPKPSDPSHWAVVAAGLYIIDGNGDLRFYRFDTRGVTTVLHDARFLTDWSMAISPDGREIVWAQIDESAADLMLVENFR